MEAALEAEGLVKRYGARTAVDDLSFRVPAGSIYGVLGPNGAGKIVDAAHAGRRAAPERRTHLCAGRSAQRAKPCSRVGYLPEERGLYRSHDRALRHRLSSRASRASPAGKALKRADRCWSAHGLGNVRRKKVKTLSKGMAQKVQVLAAIAHEPELHHLRRTVLRPRSGEPARAGRDHPRASRARARTILFSTHVMEHAERLCDRILLIAHGRAAFEGTVRDALALAPSLAVLETDGAYDIAPVLAPRGFHWTEEQGEHGNRRWRVRSRRPRLARSCLQVCVEAGAPLTLFEPARASLHEAFVALVGDKMPRARSRAMSSVSLSRGAIIWLMSALGASGFRCSTAPLIIAVLMFAPLLLARAEPPSRADHRRRTRQRRRGPVERAAFAAMRARSARRNPGLSRAAAPPLLDAPAHRRVRRSARSRRRHRRRARAIVAERAPNALRAFPQPSPRYPIVDPPPPADRGAAAAIWTARRRCLTAASSTARSTSAATKRRADHRVLERQSQPR